MINELKQYSDEKNNIINYSGTVIGNMKISFTGSNNVLNVHPNAKIKGVTFLFDCDNAICDVGANSFTGLIRLGQDCRVKIGDNVNCTGGCYISTAEGSTVTIGDDCMIATQVEIRSDDAHAFFDVETGLRLNPSRDITVGNHVWLATKSTILNGSEILDGSILGYGSILKGRIPNNSVAAGVPAKVVKRNIAWERPHLNLVKPYYKPDHSCITKSEYWNITASEEFSPVKPGILQRFRLAWRFLRTGKY